MAVWLKFDFVSLGPVSLLGTAGESGISGLYGPSLTLRHLGQSHFFA